VNIVLHDGNFRVAVGKRGPSVAAAETIMKRYVPTHKFVTLLQWV
jgi:hypothetical protein